MSKKTFYIIIAAVAILLTGGWIYYWFFYQANPAAPVVNIDNTPSTTFTPINRPGVTPPAPAPVKVSTTTAVSTPVPQIQLPILRQLSGTPIGGFAASSTASSSLARFIDRGTGHMYEAVGSSNFINKISNTTIPRIYESFWNKSANAGILQYIKDTSGAIVSFYAEIRPIITSTSTPAGNTTPYEIKGRFLSPSIKEIAVSPKGDRIFTINIENGRGVGYISGFDESKKTKVLDTPLTQVIADWPEENTATLTTKASGVSSGFFYFLNTKDGSFTKVLGPITGLSAKASSDAKEVLLSSTAIGGFSTALFNIKNNSTQEVVFKTLADKCVWSKIHPEQAYCAVPTEIPTGLYPDDWYKGNVSFIDQIWSLDSITGEVHLVANPLTLANVLMDATNLTLDPKENFLYFINKRDLTLWSLDLNN